MVPKPNGDHLPMLDLKSTKSTSLFRYDSFKWNLQMQWWPLSIQGVPDLSSSPEVLKVCGGGPSSFRFVVLTFSLSMAPLGIHKGLALILDVLYGVPGWSGLAGSSMPYLWCGTISAHCNLMRLKLHSTELHVNCTAFLCE